MNLSPSSSHPDNGSVPPGAGPDPAASAGSIADGIASKLLKDAENLDTTPFDYVIVGSGAGGGPLACRLARGGKRVLLLEAGADPAKSSSVDFPSIAKGAIHDVPGFHAAATEDQEMSWQFTTRHFPDTLRQKQDPKYAAESLHRDGPNRPPVKIVRDDRGETGGIFYPRSAGLGGCTGHHAMIVIRPNDRDWDHIADLTGDPSWRAGAMNPYFAKFERCLYVDEFRGFLGRLFGPVSKAWQAFAEFVNPRSVDDRGGHGADGWQPTSFISPELIKSFAIQDKPFIKLLIATFVISTGTNRLVAAAKRLLAQFGVIQPFDPNDTRTRLGGGEGVYLIPTGFLSGTAKGKEEGLCGGGHLLRRLFSWTAKGKEKELKEEDPLKGKRAGVREFILQTQQEFPGRLVVEQNVHVLRVLFGPGEADPPKKECRGEERLGQGEPPLKDPPPPAPRAIGVEYQRGEHLYTASPLHGRRGGDGGKPKERYFTKGEVILCGGTFNTPQLLMLSGIGDREDLAKHGVTGLAGEDGKLLVGSSGPVHLPGVGKNLQDRYEVSVITEVKEDFAALAKSKLSFIPGDPDDDGQAAWLKDKSGLYASNGGTLAIMRRSSQADGPEPDLFTFGAPVAFRGYYWGWSEELLRRIMRPHEQRGEADTLQAQRNLWSWVILKAYTHNDGGTVSLRSGNPFDTPVICFNSFDATPGEGWKKDLRALMEAVREAREINKKAGQLHPNLLSNEVQPGAGRPYPERKADSDEDDLDSKLAQWIKNEAWGHHACGTCRIGADPWRDDTSKLLDKRAVLDSSFRVHGVQGLRVVDASVFPKIPGYFILAPVFMISEKAADTLLAEAACAAYPAAFEDQEARAVMKRRQRAHPDPAAAANPASGPPAGELASLPPDTVGLALSGGGIRSATFALGLLQALARANRLREVDFLSTVSGGGFTGSFLGRLFTRKEMSDSPDPCTRVQDTLGNTRSAQLRWLRTQANYLFASGPEDVKSHLAVFFRNLFTVHLIIGTLLYAIFALIASLPALFAFLGDLRGLGGEGKPGIYNLLAALPLQEGFASVAEFLMHPPVLKGITLSPWWWLPAVALLAGVLPGSLGYWLAPKNGATRVHPFFALLAWIILVAGTIFSLVWLPATWRWTGLVAGVVLGLGWVWQETARWGLTRDTPLRAHGAIVRNRMTRSLGAAMMIFFALLAWVALDTFAILTAEGSYTIAATAVMAAFTPAMPYLNKLAGYVMKLRDSSPEEQKKKSMLPGFTNFLGPLLALALIFYVDVLAHEAFFLHRPTPWGWLSVIIALAFSAAVGRAFDFLNFSTLGAAYGTRITRTFQGASNEARIYPTSNTDYGKDVQVSHPGDDLAFHRYHPEEAGGPLHLINVCVNQTVEEASQRQIRDAKGMPMSVGPCGVAVGSRFFALWSKPDRIPGWMKRRRKREGLDDEGSNDLPIALNALPASHDPNGFHPLVTKCGEQAAVESLTLGEWVALSGAAFSTGLGRNGSLKLSLFMGLVNFRLGRWWNSGILSHERPGNYRLNLWRKIKRLPVSAFRMQSLLLSEWQSRFHGPNLWHWHLSDGGHFENTAAYELIRRRLPLIIVSDAGADKDYEFTDVAVLMREVREDFGVEIEWLSALEAKGQHGENTLLQSWIQPGALGEVDDLGRIEGTRHAALATIRYPGGKTGWLLLLKPSLTQDESLDTGEYAKTNVPFPQQPTSDQIFDSAQWESYRILGLHVGEEVILPKPPSAAALDEK